ncbi:MAG: cysteine desulfurase NifS [Candidatus Aenigmarchaeota archaeon]|nr:cysteine desulfurase NifS [Candidatus Aenigmarchaeota archaeon]
MTDRRTIYLDNSATTQVHPEVIDTIQPYLSEKYGNPSSIYHKGREAKEAVEDARKKVADLINAEPEEIIFTGSGTEGNNMALKGIAFANKNRGKHIITTKIEHKSILNSAGWLERNGFDVTYLNVDENGTIDIEQLKKEIRSDTILVSVMFANNEVGTIQPIEEIKDILKNKNIYLHTDAVQTAGKFDLDVKELGIDLLTLSGHKMHATKGIGALYIKKGTKIEPFLHGGGQERNLRSGTENVPEIVGMGKAAEIAKKDLEKNRIHLKKLEKKLKEDIFRKIPELILNGHPEKRLPGNLNISFKYIEGESVVLMLDEKDICVSTGSACTSNSLKPSYVLTAMKKDPVFMHGSIRFSIGAFNTEEDIDTITKTLPEIIKSLRAISPLYNKD